LPWGCGWREIQGCDFHPGYLLSKHTGATVGPTDIPSIVDGEAVDQCWMAVENEPWVTGPTEADEALNSTSTTRHNIIEPMRPGNENDEESAWGCH
jgi:hypothetical protein